MRRRWVMLAGVLVVAGCAQAPDDPGSPVTVPMPSATVPSSTQPQTEGSELRSEEAPPMGLDEPPPVTIGWGNESLDLTAYTYCFGRVCADGFPPDNPPDVGSPEQVTVDFPLDGWSFSAIFEPSDDGCGRVQSVELTPSDDGDGSRFVVEPVGYADTYDVTLFGRGDGDLFVTFRWTTPTAGPVETPQARLAILADNDGQVDSYGVSLHLDGLASTPEQAEVTITVVDADGDEVTVEAERTDGECLEEGTVYWDGSDESGLEAALGDGPFTYEVEVVLDGIAHVATATWPDDVIAGNEPSVALDFEPPLPSLPPADSVTDPAGG